MSAIYNDLFKKLDPGRFKDSAPDPLYLEAGLAFESMLEEGLKRRMAGERPGEFLTVPEHGEQAVAYSPDLLIQEGDRWRLGEIKLTWMSSRGCPTEPGGAFPPKFDKYFVQMKAYCYHLGTPLARLIVFFVNGDYKPPKPQLLAWDIEFSQMELRENWAMLVNHARARGMM